MVRTISGSFDIIGLIRRISGDRTIAGVIFLFERKRRTFCMCAISFDSSIGSALALEDRSGIANSLGQMGRIFYAQKNYREALRSFHFAFLIFDELKSPSKDLAGKDIMKLKEEIGDELFNKYYQEITSDEQREKDNN